MKLNIFKKLGFGVFILLITTDSIAEMSSTEKVFTEIYEKRWWWTGETNSGCGSNLYQTQLIRNIIPYIVHQFNIQSIVDIPCGDFHWMKEVALEIPYIGADIVKSLILENQRRYQNNKRTFLHLDIITSDLPCADLVFCRDCFVHLSYEQICQALKNIKKSGSKYILTTCYTDTKQNTDTGTGGWRTLNLMVPPFNFQHPLFIFNEGYERDKSLVLWKLDDLNL